MLKIYFDWNCITHSKDRYPHILKIAKECGGRFIFPYSNAHIRDLLMSRSNNNEYFAQDLDLLTSICGKHLLQFDNNIMQPFLGSPKDYIEECGVLLEIVQKTEFLSPSLYQKIKEQTRGFIPKDLFKRIQGASPKDAIRLIDEYIRTIQPDKNLFSFMSDSNPIKQFSTFESQFKSVCLGLDIFGYHPENKNKQITNIDADASHIFYAAHCDYLVSADKGLRAKAEAMYKEYGFATKVIRPEEICRIIDDEYNKGYNLTYLLECIETYGIPRFEEDGAHYRLMPIPIFGLFNICMKIDKEWGYEADNKSAVFRYSFNCTPYLFFTELESFFYFVQQLLPETERLNFVERFVKPMTSHSIKTTATAKYICNIPEMDLVFQFLSDPLSSVPCPMMQVIVGEKCEEMVKKMM